MRILKLLGYLVFTAIIVASAGAATENISNKNALVTFSGEHAGMVFSGKFEQWQGSIVLPPQENPSIQVKFDLKSAKTGDFTYDSTLPEGDWFDTENYPTGTFTSSKIAETDDGFRVEGMLTLKGKSKTQTFNLKENGSKLIADFSIDRIEYAIGLDSDPDAEWVSRHIQMRIEIPKNN